MTETSKTSHDAARASSKEVPGPVPKLETSMYMGLTASMALQLAVVLVVGVFGGHWLDGVFSTTPVLTTIGMGLAVVAMILIVRRTLQQLNVFMKRDEK